MSADLIRCGLRLRDVGSVGFTWSDLRDFVRFSPPDSALSRAQHGEKSEWGVAEYLLALIADATRLSLWAKTKDASRGVNRPPLVPRPGDELPSEGGNRGDPDVVALPVDELERRLALPRE